MLCIALYDGGLFHTLTFEWKSPSTTRVPAAVFAGNCQNETHIGAMTTGILSIDTVMQYRSISELSRRLYSPKCDKYLHVTFLTTFQRRKKWHMHMSVTPSWKIFTV